MDERYGKIAEEQALSVLQAKFGEKLHRSTSQFSTYDYTDGEGLFIELKARRCYSYTYPDTMVGYNKIELANKHPEHRYVFAFKFLDGLYYREHLTGETYRTDTGGRCDRGRPEYKQYCYIKKELLYKLQ